MATAAHAPFKGLPPKKVDGHRFRVGIVYARWNLRITTALVDGAKYAGRERHGSHARTPRTRTAWALAERGTCVAWQEDVRVRVA